MIPFLLIGLLIGALLAGWYGFERVLAHVELERDAARQEAKVFRGLICPAMNREAVSVGAPAQAGNALHGAAPGGIASGAPTKAAAPPTTNPRQRFRRKTVSFLQRFNQARADSNTPQISTNKLAEALEWQKAQAAKNEQEKTHAAGS